MQIARVKNITRKPTRKAVYKLNGFFLSTVDNLILRFSSFTQIHNRFLRTNIHGELNFFIHDYFEVDSNVIGIQHCDLARSTRTAGSKQFF